MKKLISHNTFKTIIVVVTIIGFVTIGSNCKRKDTRPYGPQYEEDPGQERGTVSERLDGVWKIEDYLLNEVSIISQPSVASSGSISIKDVHYDYKMPTKDNGWHESYLVYPWRSFALISKDSITYSGDDTSFCYWFTNPILKTNSVLYKGWQITKLYQGSLHLKIATAKGIYKIYWKK